MLPVGAAHPVSGTLKAQSSSYTAGDSDDSGYALLSTLLAYREPLTYVLRWLL